MNNPVLTLIGDLFKPAAELVDNLHTSEEERIDAKTRMLEAQTAVTFKILDYEAQIAQMKTNVIMAEATGDSWLQRNWRPITMLTMLFLVVGHHVGVFPNELSEEAWLLLQLGLGGYIAGRSGEKIMKSYKA